MARYIAKRIVYMLIMLLVLSLSCFNLQPDAEQQGIHRCQRRPAVYEGQASCQAAGEMFDKLYLDYQRNYGTDTDNLAIRYLRWIGVYPMYCGNYDGLFKETSATPMMPETMLSTL